MSWEAQIVVKYRAGKTYHQLGEEYGLTRERIGQIVRKAGAAATTGEKRQRISKGVSEWHKKR